MVTRIGEKLPVLVEDRVRSEAGLEGVSLGLGNLVELGVEVAAALERDVDGPVEGQSVGRAVVLGTGGQRERADKRGRRRRERLRLRPCDRRLKSGRRRRRSRVDDRGGNASGNRDPGSAAEIATGTGQIAEAAAPRAWGVSHKGRKPAELGKFWAGTWALSLGLSGDGNGPNSQSHGQTASQPIIHHCIGSLPGPVEKTGIVPSPADW